MFISHHKTLCCLWRTKELRTISNPLAVGPSDRRVERLLKTINLRPALSQALKTTPTTSAFLSKAGKPDLICQYLGVMGAQYKRPTVHYSLCFSLKYCFPLYSLVVDEVWKQQTLLQLLQTVEVPMLDCILTSPARGQLQACRTPLAAQDLVISNTCLERELPDTLNLPQSVLWLIFPTFFFFFLHCR